MAAAHAQRTVVPGEDVAADIVGELAEQLLALDERISTITAKIKITTAFRTHPQADIIDQTLHQSLHQSL